MLFPNKGIFLGFFPLHLQLGFVLLAIVYGLYHGKSRLNHHSTKKIWNHNIESTFLVQILRASLPTKNPRISNCLVNLFL